MQLTVADNGQGIRKEVIGQIFEPFYTTKGDKGSGLGLWVTKDLVEKHGGKINVRSTSLGTCFVVRIPVGHPAKVLERAV
jgi:signal transduction histidine kinase